MECIAPISWLCSLPICRRIPLRTGYRCIGLEQSDAIARLHFANGETVESRRRNRR